MSPPVKIIYKIIPLKMSIFKGNFLTPLRCFSVSTGYLKF
ncbi:conserved hypothetical protein [Treponema phagedenis]|uniref:Uncharacterized protein n=1 Tax=Treponema phagedenis TaxID=162 RepID=A0A0B7GV71_TREPH|nr:hypothetical protein HMPREF9554_00476 [Treponema phagedenis F0421]CEM60870.1 conserved hypothetical protein [Treponema phagedenis]